MRRSVHETARTSGIAGWRAGTAAVVAFLLAGPTLGPGLLGQEDPSRATRYLAWELGSKVSLAALGYGQGASADAVDRIVARVRPVAEFFGATVPAFPPRTGEKAHDAAGILYYLLNTLIDSVGYRIEAKYPNDHALLFQIAMKSNILLLMYSPDDDTGRTIATVIRDQAARAGIPYNVWRPVVTAIEQGLPFSDVKAAVITMHEQMTEFLGPGN